MSIKSTRWKGAGRRDLLMRCNVYARCYALSNRERRAVFVYLLGLAVIPIAAGALLKTYDSARPAAQFDHEPSHPRRAETRSTPSRPAPMTAR